MRQAVNKRSFTLTLAIVGFGFAYGVIGAAVIVLIEIVQGSAVDLAAETTRFIQIAVAEGIFGAMGGWMVAGMLARRTLHKSRPAIVRCFLTWGMGSAILAAIVAQLLSSWPGATLSHRIRLSGWLFAIYPMMGMLAAHLATIHIPDEPDGPPQCSQCQYNLTGNVSGVCPECGTRISEK